MTTRIRSRVDGLSVPPNVVLDKGDEGDCPDDRAKSLFARGLAEPADASAERASAHRSARPETTEGRRPRKQD